MREEREYAACRPGLRRQQAGRGRRCPRPRGAERASLARLGAPDVANRYGVVGESVHEALREHAGRRRRLFRVSGFLLFRPFARALLHDRGAPFAAGVLPQPGVADSAGVLGDPAARHALVPARAPRPAASAPRELDLPPELCPLLRAELGHGYGIAPAWSLCVEVVFYLVLPLLVLLAMRARHRTGRRSRAATLPIVLLAVLGIGSTALSQIDRLGAMFQDSFPTHAHWFAVGMALAVVRVRWEDQAFTVRPWMRPSAGLLAVVSPRPRSSSPIDGITTFLDEQTIFAICAGLFLAMSCSLRRAAGSWRCSRLVR